MLFSSLNSDTSIAAKAEDIISRIGCAIQYQGRKLYAQTSIGIATHSPNISAEQLIQHADTAMYEAKEKGRNQYCFFDFAMEQKLNERYYYESELAHALSADQFILHYQPKVNCSTGKIIGLEALIRWQHPEKGLIPPGVFIPILESSSQITSLTYWILDNVCQQIKAWREQLQLNIPIAVNLSGKDFLDAHLAEKIISSLERYSIPPNLIEFEITETVLTSNMDHCIQLMTELKELGIKFSIDDFGTGYSSMSYLKKFPIDTLKIDAAFIQECHSNKEDAAICTTILALGKNLDLNVIAEGVEQQEQLDFLNSIACDDYQGFLFSKPLAGAGVTVLLASEIK